MAEAQAGGSGNTGQATIGEDTRKLSKSEAGYREDQGITGLRCGDCIFFEAGACQIVEGRIDEDDVCDQFEPNLKDGSMQAEQAVERSVRATDMWITRVSKDKKTGKRRWYATSSGVKKDLYNERMSVDLFDDFIKRIDAGDEPPPMFTSDAWSGGMPYLGVAHYLDLNGDGIVGPTLQVWRDGNVLKAKGEFQETPLAEAAFKAIQQDQIENRADNERVRISIAFIDWGHNHGKGKEFTRKSLSDTCMYCEAGVGDKEYTAGHLVHLALTRRPAYPETEIVALEEKSMSKRRDDAASIVGEEMADELEKRMKESLVGRSDGNGKVATGAIVVKDEGGQQESEAEVEHALGGARTLDEAEAYLTKSETVLLNSWGVLEDVLSNIVEDEEKALAVRAVVRDFQNTLDVRAAEAILNVERALGGDLVAEKTTDAVERQVPPQFREDEEEERKKKRQPEEEMADEDYDEESPREEKIEEEVEEEELEEDRGDDEDEEEEKKKMKEKSTASEHPLDAVFASVRIN